MIVCLKCETSLWLYVDKTVDSEGKFAQPSVLVFLIIALEVRSAFKCREGKVGIILYPDGAC